MTILEFLSQILDLDVRLWVDDEGQLRYNAPRGVVTPELRAGLIGRKAEIIDFLKGGNTAQPAALPTIVPAPDERQQPFPLTDVQQAYWIGRSSDFELGNVATHLYMEVEHSSLDLGRLERAWQRLIERHDMMRAIIRSDGLQQILEHVPLYQVEVLDLRGQAPEAVRVQLEAVRERMSHQVLPSGQWPLFEICASRLEDAYYRLHISLDFLIADAWSMQILSRELSQLYKNPDTPLPPLEISFRDYILAEASIRELEQYRRSLEYWRNRLPALPPAPELPLAKNPTSLTKPQFVRRQARLEPGTWSRLKARATQAGLTPSGVLLAAYAQVLTVWSKNPRFTINLTLFHRLPLHTQVDSIVGDFTSLTLLAVDNTLQDGFETRAQRLQRQLWEDLNHSYVSGVQVIRELAQAQEDARGAAMPIVFTSTLTQLTPDQEALAVSDAATSDGPPSLIDWNNAIYAISQTPQVWVDHQISEQEGALVFNWDAVEALFPEGLLDDMFEAYCGLLQRLANDGSAWQQTTGQLVPALAAQLEQRTAVNATRAPISDALLHTLFADQVRQRPHQEAVIASQRRLTYEALYRSSNQIGHWLRERGARPNRLIGVVMEKGWEQVAAVLGVLNAGAAYLPIDPDLPQKRVWYLIEHGEVELVLTQPWLEERLAWPAGVERLCVADEALEGLDDAPLEPVQGVEDLAYVIFTSGSTGLPKGVMIDHRGAVNTILDINRRFGVTPKDRVLALSQLNFDLSVYDIFGLLAAGGTIVIPDAEGRRDPAHWLALMTRERVTLWDTVPALMEMLVEYGEGRAERLPGLLRLVFMSGDWIPVTLPDRIRALADGVAVWSGGGATEASIWSILYPIKEVAPDWKSIPYGKPMVNQSFQVLDGALEPRPVWVPGDLYIGGVGLAQGYWQDAEKTADSFITHPRTGERLYRTGDLGRYLPDGNIEFIGREDFQVKIRGHRIELGEIEAVLTQHPAVRTGVVTAVGQPGGDPAIGLRETSQSVGGVDRAGKRLVAYVVPDQESTTSIFEVVEPAKEPLHWDALVQAGRQQVQRQTPPQADALFLAAWQQLEQLFEHSVYFALRELGAFIQPGEKHCVDDLLHQCQIRPRYKKWLCRNLEVLTAKGFLRRENGFFENAWSRPTESLEELASAFMVANSEYEAGACATAPDPGRVKFELDNPHDLPRHLADILTERVHSAEVYLSDETISVYHTFHYCNSIVREVMAALTKSLSPEKPLRILEVGAGFGTTTSYVLPVLPPQQAVYNYTDISRYFLKRAEEEFAAYPFIRTGLLNIEREPQGQGYEPHAFDVVIASSVLHATRSIKESLQHIRSLLTPSGLLVLVEETRFHRVFDLGMGLQQGFDRFEDNELRQTHPLLSAEQWGEVLLAQEFQDVVLLNETDSMPGFLGLDVLLARGPASVKRFAEGKLRDYLGARLPEYMVPSAFVLLDAIPLTPNGKVDRRALPEPDDLRPEPEMVRYVAPRDEIEETLTGLWQQVLNIELVGVHDNFFEIGGDSLVVMRLLNQINQEFEVDIPIRNLFEHPTVAGIAELIRASKSQLFIDETPIAERLNAVFPTERKGVLEAYLQQKIARSLGVEIEQLTPGRNLAKFDLEQLTIDLMQSMRQDLKLQLQLGDVASRPSIRELAHFVLIELDRQQLVANLDEISDEEVAAKLGELLAEREG